jgi:signal transduction histidine kinase
MHEGAGHIWRFTPQAWLPLAGFVLTLALGLYIWSRRKRALLNQSFAALNVAAAFWNLDIFLLFTVRDIEVAGSLDRLLQIPMVSIPFLALHFFFVFLGRRRSHPLLVGFGLWTIALWCLSSSPDFIASWEQHWYGYYGRAGKLYPLFILTLFVYLAVSCRMLIQSRRKSLDPLLRNQIIYLLLANIVFALVSLHNFGPLYGAARIPLGNLATVLYFFIISATIVRYRFMDAHLLFRYGLIYSSLTFILSGLYLLLILGLQGWFQEEVFAGSLLLPMMPAVVVAFAVGPLKSSLQERLDRHFFRSRALLRSRLAGFADAITPLEKETAIWRAAWDRGWRCLDPDWVSMTSVKEGRRFPVVTAGVVPGPSETEVLLLPLEGRSGALGFCRLGPKRGGDIYSPEEVGFGKAIASQTALAIERVRLSEEGRRKERLAAMGKTAAVISHELRNFLNSIRAAAALLRNRLAGGEEESLLDLLEKEIRRGDRYIADVLSACRESRPARCAVDLGDFLKRFSRTWPQGDFSAMKVDLHLPQEPLVFRADPVQLERVLQNLGRNSAEATGGSGTVKMACRSLKGGRVEILFSDDGPGIDGEIFPSLFEPFSTSRKNGTGLGLSIAKAIVDAHGGTVEARAPDGSGACFRMVLPVGEESAVKGNGWGGK